LIPHPCGQSQPIRFPPRNMYPSARARIRPRLFPAASLMRNARISGARKCSPSWRYANAHM
jgi:hypothetical protein